MRTIIFVSFFLLLSHLLPAQNIGIGTNTPTEKLHVVGNVKADTAKLTQLNISNALTGQGKVLVSDQNGNGIWTSMKKLVDVASNSGQLLSSVPSVNNTWQFLISTGYTSLSLQAGQK